jgi:hypothetical protein
MGVMVGFALGYVLGTRAGEDGYQEMMTALKTITSSGELKELAGAAVGMLADLLKQGTGALGDANESKLRRIA